MSVDGARGPTVLLTGAAGFIGRNVHSRLLQRNCTVVGIDDLSVTPRIAPASTVAITAVADLTVADLDGVHVVLHLAGHKSVQGSFLEDSICFDDVSDTHHLLRLFERSTVARLMLISTCEIYGEQPEAAAEDTTADPRSPYAVAKLAMEHLGRLYQPLCGDREICVVRLFNCYGPDENVDAVVPAFIDQLRDGGVIRIEGSGTQSRDFSYISDTADALCDLVIAPELPDVINIGSGVATSVRDIAQLLMQITGTGRVEYATERPNEVSSFVADTTRSQKVLGPAVNTELVEGLIRTVEHFGSVDPQ